MQLFRKLVEFIGISGLGWCLDFAIFTLLTSVFNLNVVAANYISTAPAITLVFFLSTKQIFQAKKDGIPLCSKYLIYIIYQFLLVSAVSWLGQFAYDFLVQLNLPEIIFKYLKLIIKIGITPVTMLLNFFVLGKLVERL